MNSRTFYFHTFVNIFLQEQFKKLVEIEERILEGLQGESLATASRVNCVISSFKKLALVIKIGDNDYKISYYIKIIIYMYIE